MVYLRYEKSDEQGGEESRKMIRKYNIVVSISCILSFLFFILLRTEINRINGRVMMIRIIL